MSRKLNIVATAYACEPGRGSEPGIGWNIVRELAEIHSICVITRENHQSLIDEALRERPSDDIRFVYFDLPKWARWWKRGTRGLMLYYYLWQFGAARKAKSLMKEESFDLCHHVTFGRYWNPSYLPSLGIPFVWGPVGGGESSPKIYTRSFSFKGRVYEGIRDLARTLGALDPFVRRSAKKSRLALATTRETEKELKKIGASNVVLLGNVALNSNEMEHYSLMEDSPLNPIRFISMGRLLNWKGFHLGLSAFAEAKIEGAEYWFVGSGPYESELKRLAAQLGIEDKVVFHGQVTREETFKLFESCHALVHPSLHDSGGWVCIEAMASGRPVICLDLGGPAVVVDQESGYVVSAESPEKSIEEMTTCMIKIASSRDEWEKKSSASRRRAQSEFSWEKKAELIAENYSQVLNQV